MSGSELSVAEGIKMDGSFIHSCIHLVVHSTSISEHLLLTCYCPVTDRCWNWPQLELYSVSSDRKPSRSAFNKYGFSFFLYNQEAWSQTITGIS